MSTSSRSADAGRDEAAAERERSPAEQASLEAEPASAPVLAPGPASAPGPAKIDGGSLRSTLRRTATEFRRDNLTDWAAALTYYGVLSIFPGMLVLAAVLGLLGDSAKQELLDNISEIAPGQVTDILRGAIDQPGRGAGIVAIIGLLVAFWSASGYVAAFMRASNAVYDVPEGRPIWKTVPIRVAVTAVTGLMLVISVTIVVFTGRVAEQVGSALGFGSAAVTAWDIAKWPVLVVLVSLMFAILYWASPNAKTGGFRWFSPGGVLAVLLWVAVSAGFALYVAAFGASSYSRTYGALGGVIIFLVWLWISNIAILLGAELDAELERRRAIAAGHPADEEPYLELRDDRKLDRRKEPDLR